MKASEKATGSIDTPDGRPDSAPMRGRHQADIAIVGGGVTGCAAACLFARAGARVVLIEARRIGRGSTAASTALLMQEPDVDFARTAGTPGSSSRSATVATG